MRLIPPSATACEHARESISLALDGELTELESARLEAHVDGCASCRAFQAEAVTVAETVRAEPLAVPSFEIVLPRTRRVPVRLIQASAAAAAVALLGAASLANGLGHRSAAPRPAQATQNLSVASLVPQVPNRDLQKPFRPKFPHAV